MIYTLAPSVDNLDKVIKLANNFLWLEGINDFSFARGEKSCFIIKTSYGTQECSIVHQSHRMYMRLALIYAMGKLS